MKGQMEGQTDGQTEREEHMPCRSLNPQTLSIEIKDTVKPALSGHLKIDKTKVLMENGSLMKVKSIAECSLCSILQYF